MDVDTSIANDKSSDDNDEPFDVEDDDNDDDAESDENYSDGDESDESVRKPKARGRPATTKGSAAAPGKTRSSNVILEDSEEEEDEAAGMAEPPERRPDDECWECRDARAKPNNDIVYCSECAAGFHQLCHTKGKIGGLAYAVPPGYWRCKYCSQKRLAKHNGAWKLALEELAAAEHRVAVAGPLRWYAKLEAAPALDLYNGDAVAPRAYVAWVHNALKWDANFVEAFAWLSAFGDALGISAPSFAELESAFHSPLTSVLLATLHVKLLKCLGVASADSVNWPRKLADLVLGDDDGEPAAAAAFKDVLRLGRSLAPPTYPADAGEATSDAEAEGTGATAAVSKRASPVRSSSTSRSKSSTAAAAAAAAADSDEGEDSESEEEEEEGFDYFRQALPVRTLLLRTLCDEALASTHKANTALQNCVRSLEQEALEDALSAAGGTSQGAGKRGKGKATKCDKGGGVDDASSSSSVVCLEDLSTKLRQLCVPIFSAPLLDSRCLRPFGATALEVPAAGAGGVSVGSSSSSLPSSGTSTAEPTVSAPLPPLLAAAKEVATAARSRGICLKDANKFVTEVKVEHKRKVVESRWGNAKQSACSAASGAGTSASATAEDDELDAAEILLRSRARLLAPLLRVASNSLSRSTPASAVSSAAAASFVVAVPAALLTLNAPAPTRPDSSSCAVQAADPVAISLQPAVAVVGGGEVECLDEDELDAGTSHTGFGAAGRSAAAESLPRPPTPPSDPRCLRYFYFQDSAGSVRLVRQRVTLPFECAPRNPTLRTLVVTRAAIAELDFIEKAAPKAPAAAAPASASAASLSKSKAAIAPVVTGDSAKRSRAEAEKAVASADAAGVAAKRPRTEQDAGSKADAEKPQRDKAVKHKNPAGDKAAEKDKKPKSSGGKAASPSSDGLKQTTLSFGAAARPSASPPAGASAAVPIAAAAPKALGLMAIPKKETMSLMAIPKKAGPPPASSGAAAAAPTAAAIAVANALRAGVPLPPQSNKADGATTSSSLGLFGTLASVATPTSSNTAPAAASAEQLAPPQAPAAASSARVQTSSFAASALAAAIAAKERPPPRTCVTSPSSSSLAPTEPAKATKQSAPRQRIRVSPLQPLPLPDGLVLAVTPAAPLESDCTMKPGCDFETLAETVDELKEFAQIALLSPHDTERALGWLLEERVIPKAFRMRKTFERQQRNKEAVSAAPSSLGDRRVRKSVNYNIDAAFHVYGIK